MAIHPYHYRQWFTYPHKPSTVAAFPTNSEVCEVSSRQERASSKRFFNMSLKRTLLCFIYRPSHFTLDRASAFRPASAKLQKKSIANKHFCKSCIFCEETNFPNLNFCKRQAETRDIYNIKTPIWYTSISTALTTSLANKMPSYAKTSAKQSFTLVKFLLCWTI